MSSAFQSNAFQTVTLAFQIDAASVAFSGISTRNFGGISYLTITDPSTAILGPISKSVGITEISYTIDGEPLQ